jgi:hypothetical protein
MVIRVKRVTSIIASCCLIGCSSIATKPVSQVKVQITCSKTELFPISEEQLKPIPSTVNISGIKISNESLLTANILGITPLLAEWAKNSKNLSAVQELALKQKIINRITLANLEVASTLAYIDCAGERTDHLRDRLQRHETKRIENLTLASIIVGAGTVITSGALALGSATNAGNIAAIIGGTAEGGLGIYAVQNREIVDAKPQRNMLAEIWNGPSNTSAFPPVVWRYLNSPMDPGGTLTIRDTLKNEWGTEEQLGKPGGETEKRRMAQILGEEGTYTLDDLRAREGMEDLVEARISMFNQNLAKLLREFLVLSDKMN